MSLEKLREAIEKVDFEIGEHPAFYAKDLIPILAAARAYSCKRCNGTKIERFRSGLGDVNYYLDERDCTGCAEWRKMADE